MEASSKPLPKDEGEKIPVENQVIHRIPVKTQMPEPDDRIYYNANVEKPKRKINKLEIQFGKLTDQNCEQFRILNYLTLPVVYSSDFYTRLTNYSRYSQLGYYKDVLVGAVSCRYEDEMTDVPDGSDQEPVKTGNKVVYIMTITVLKAYRRYQIGT